MAGASATMIVVLELVLPVDAVDEALARPSSGGAVAAWDDVAWGELLLLEHRRSHWRLVRGSGPEA